MATLNYAAKEIVCKIVYYGTAYSGKTTNLQQIHGIVGKDSRGQLISLATGQDRTIYFDFLPLDLGNISGFRTKFQLYTVPGQVIYNATRKLVLRGVDGVVLVVDSHPGRMQDNCESLRDLQVNLAEYGVGLNDVPWVLQYNKRDLPDALSLIDLQREVNIYGVPYVEAVACESQGVKETLKLIAGLVLEKAGALSELTSPSPLPQENTAPDKEEKPDEKAQQSSDPPKSEQQKDVEDTANEPPEESAEDTDENEEESAVASPDKPQNVAVRQRCDIYWRKYKIGVSTLELRTRMNFDKRGEYQLAEHTRYLLLFSSVRLRILRYIGKNVYNINKRKSVLHMFEEYQENKKKNSKRQAHVWFGFGLSHQLFVRRSNLFGLKLRYTPEGKIDVPNALKLDD